MSISVGYGQYFKHINTKPDLENDIYDLSTLCISRYHPDQPSTDNVKEILSRSPRYYFNVSTKAKSETTASRHSYYFDNKEEASVEHKKLRIRLYDQLTEPLLKKLQHTSQLSIQEQTFLDSIVSRIECLR